MVTKLNAHCKRRCPTFLSVWYQVFIRTPFLALQHYQTEHIDAFMLELICWTTMLNGPVNGRTAICCPFVRNYTIVMFTRRVLGGATQDSYSALV